MAIGVWKPIIAASLVAAYLAVARNPLWTYGRFTTAFALAFVAQTALYTVWSIFLYPIYLSPLRGLPEPKGNHWLLGQFPRLQRDPTGVPAREWVNTLPHNGMIRYRGIFNQERVVVASPKALSEVMVTSNYTFFKPTIMTETLSRTLGVGVLLAEGEQHRFQRKSLMPAFAFRHIKDLYPTFWRKARQCTEAMTKEIDEAVAAAASEAPASSDEKLAGTSTRTATLEVMNWASRATLDIIGKAGMGVDFGSIADPHSELARTYDSIIKPSPSAQRLGLLSLLLPSWLVQNLPFERNSEIHRAAQVIRARCHTLITEKKEKAAKRHSEKGIATTGDTADATAPTDFDILSVALESGSFTDENLVDQLMTFLAAGHETTASGLTWAAYMLARHPEVQERLRAEVRAHLPSLQSSDGDSQPLDVSSLDIDRLPYLQAVCSEVLRLWAPVPMTLREAGPGASIQGLPIPEGTRVMLFPWAVNHSEELWGADAHEFKPERWLAKASDNNGNQEDDNGTEQLRATGNGGAKSNYAFMTFLHGPRSCIGQSFARAEFACLVACWAGRFAFELANEEERDERNVLIKGGITARPANGMHLRVTALDGW